MTTSLLSGSLEATLLLKMGFETLTDIQNEAIPLLAEGNSVLALAPTGSGKTLAFLVPLMLKIRPNVLKTQLLILAPTRELGLQIAQVAERVAQNMSGLVQGSLLVRTAFGGTKVENQKTELSKNPHVVVATPGRALDLAERDLLDLNSVNAIVLDEADLMLGMGFAAEMTSICSFLPKNVQAALFTATEATLPGELEARLLMGAARVDVCGQNSSDFEPGTELAPAVHEFLQVANHGEKRSKLVSFLQEVSERVTSGIIFCQTREAVRTLSEFLRDKGFSAEELSGDLGQIQRSTILRRFKAGGVKYLVATNIAARGIDVKDLSLVVHFDLPSTTEEYVHRSGRSGRAGKQGWTVSLCPTASKEFLFALVKDLDMALKPFLLGTSDRPSAAAEPLLKKQMRKLHFNRGKSHKLRPGDIVGTLTQGMGLSKEDVGSIFIFDHFTHVEVNEDLVRSVIVGLEKTKIKNMTVKATEALG